MNTIERVEGEVAVLARRLRRIEELLSSREGLVHDERAAGETAARLGYRAEVIYLEDAPSNAGRKKAQGERRAVAIELRRAGWSATRIARAFCCADRTVQRWLKDGRPVSAAL